MMTRAEAEELRDSMVVEGTLSEIEGVEGALSLEGRTVLVVDASDPEIGIMQSSDRPSPDDPRRFVVVMMNVDEGDGYIISGPRDDDEPGGR